MVLKLQEKIQDLEGPSVEVDYEIMDLLDPQLALKPLAERSLTASFENSWALVERTLRMCTIDLHSDTMLVSVKVNWWPHGLSEDFKFEDTGFHYSPTHALLISTLGVLVKYENDEYGWKS